VLGGLEGWRGESVLAGRQSRTESRPGHLSRIAAGQSQAWGSTPVTKQKSHSCSAHRPLASPAQGIPTTAGQTDGWLLQLLHRLQIGLSSCENASRCMAARSIEGLAAEQQFPRYRSATSAPRRAPPHHVPVVVELDRREYSTRLRPVDIPVLLSSGCWLS